MFVCFSLPDPKIRVCVSRTEKKENQLCTNNRKKTEIKLPTATMKYRLYVTSLDILGRGRSFA